MQNSILNPKVLVRCMTYNHEKYIEDALSGFIMQKTDFPFTVAVVDDASTDNNVKVINEFISKNCNKIKNYIEEDKEYGKVMQSQATNNPNCHFYVILLNENHYSDPNKRALRHFYYKFIEDRAKYIAMCEGDDYWTDPYKLQKQIDILEADKTLMICCSACSVVDNYNKLIHAIRPEPVVKNNKEGRYTLRDFFRDNHQYPTASVLYRNTHVDEVRAKHAHTENAFLGDWTMWICLLIYGDMYYTGEVTSAYRINPTSVTHTVGRVARAKANRDICRKVADILPGEYADIAADLRDARWVWVSLIFAYKAEKRYIGMIGCLIMASIMCPKSLWNTYKKRKRKP